VSHSHMNLLVHIVFGTKIREPWLDGKVLPDVLHFLAGGIQELGGIPLEWNGMPDHVHILAKLRPDLAVSDLLRDIKARSSGWIHRSYPALASFSWQVGYGAFSVGASQVEAVRAYIRNQREHHRMITFEQEFIGLLDTAGIEYDLRYLWE